MTHSDRDFDRLHRVCESNMNVNHDCYERFRLQ